MKNFINIIINKQVSIKKYSHIDNEIKNIFCDEKVKKKYLQKYKLENYKENNFAILKKINSYNKLIFLYKLCFCHGYTEKSLRIRELIIEKMIKKKIITFEDYLSKIKSLIDTNNLKEALKSLKSKRFYFFIFPKFYIYFFYLKNLERLLNKIIFNENKFFFNISPLINNENENTFSSLIENKTIALVGPSYSKEEQGNEIDTYDLVIRLNAFENHKHEFKKYIGSKTNIVYLNGGEFTKFEKGKKTEFLKNSFLCSRKSFSEEFQKKNIRATRKLNFNLFGGNGFVQDVIIDLLHFKIKEIKVFNVDFTLNSKMYTPSYTKPNQVSQKEAYYRQSKVDFFSNINFMRLLLLNNTIMVDNNLKILLNSSNYELSKLFKKFYSIESLKIN